MILSDFEEARLTAPEQIVSVLSVMAPGRRFKTTGDQISWPVLVYDELAVSLRDLPERTGEFLADRHIAFLKEAAARSSLWQLCSKQHGAGYLPKDNWCENPARGIIQHDATVCIHQPPSPGPSGCAAPRQCTLPAGRMEQWPFEWL